MKRLALILLIFTTNANAEPCDKKEQQKTDALVEEYPLDDSAVKLSALRTGLCYYVESKKITEERAGELLEIEKQKMTLEKLAIKKDLTT
jgi:hypothetical protein